MWLRRKMRLRISIADAERKGKERIQIYVSMYLGGPRSNILS